MTPEDIERAVSTYLRRGKPGDVAGMRASQISCPVALALQERPNEWTVSVLLGQIGSMRLFGTMMSMDWLPARAIFCGDKRAPDGKPLRVNLTPRVIRFVEAVDREIGPTVTKARCRELWRQAKESAA